MRCNDVPPFSSSVGERKIMNHFVVAFSLRPAALADALATAAVHFGFRVPGEISLTSYSYRATK